MNKRYLARAEVLFARNETDAELYTFCREQAAAKRFRSVSAYLLSLALREMHSTPQQAAPRQEVSNTDLMDQFL